MEKFMNLYKKSQSIVYSCTVRMGRLIKNIEISCNLEKVQLASGCGKVLFIMFYYMRINNE
jgi:hypothetical protein